MTQFFPHEKLDVYVEALSFTRVAAELVDRWPASVSVHDQLDRASESILTNLARSARLHRTAQGIYFLECSLGAVLESAACLDVASLKGLIENDMLHSGKRQLQTVARMQMGLRRAWSKSVHEDAEQYGVEADVYFPHETLHVYQRSLQLYGVLEMRVLGVEKRRHRYARRIDEVATSLPLNIAEGNGRFSHLDHSKFVEIAEDAGTKLAAYLDLAEGLWSADVDPARPMLREVMAMLAGLRGYLDSEGEQ
ncbi:MAG: four helix bundle protein [Verrucomicrobia bacterium]|nr:four helix bundle protein [Verrucomicrobiota bacterium]